MRAAALLAAKEFESAPMSMGSLSDTGISLDQARLDRVDKVRIAAIITDHSKTRIGNVAKAGKAGG